MKFGVALFVTEAGLQPAELARLAEQHGFESFWVPDHTHIPLASQGMCPFRDDRQIPLEYRQLFDPFVALTAAATVTTTLRLGTGICLVAQRDPIATAKAVATLDLLSGGRVLFGVGAGWNPLEMQNHGVPPDRRFRVMREHVEAIRAIWTQDTASYEGEFVSFDNIWSWPKPAQRPHPPVLIAGNGPNAVNRVLAYGDEWLPQPKARLVEQIEELRERGQSEGRGEVPVTVYSAKLNEVDEYVRAGAHRCVFWLPPNDAEAARASLVEIAHAMDIA